MQELWVKSQDVELYTQVHGNADMPTVLLLHGYPDCHRTWDKQVEALQQDYQVVCFDMRGAGRSPCSAQPRSYRIENMMADIEAERAAVDKIDGVTHHSIPSDQVPTQANLDSLFNILDQEDAYPVLMHCYHGTGRAQIYSAIYRIEYEDFSNEEAREKTRILLKGSSFDDGKPKGEFLKAYKTRAALDSIN